MPALWLIAEIAASLFIHPQPLLPFHLPTQTDRREMQEEERRPGLTSNPRMIAEATEEFQKAVNGSAEVRNWCRLQGKEIQIDETAEVIQRNRCEVVLKTRKITGAPDHQKQVEFTVHANLTELTTPVLVEKQSFAQCHADGSGVLKVSSRSQPGKTLEVVRRVQATAAAKSDQGEKQTRRDLSLFFSDPAAAKRAAKALERAVESCGGQEWPDEDDLP